MPKKLLGGVCDGHTSFSEPHPSLITINTVVNGKSIYAMLDTGATTSLISQSQLDHIPHPKVNPIQTTATLGDGQTKILIKGVVELGITINDITTMITALIVDSLGANLILGMDWCKANNVTVNIGESQVEINHPQEGTTTTPFIEGGSVDVRLADCLNLFPNHEHIAKMQVPISTAMLALFLPDPKLCAKLKIQAPDALVEIKDFTFYMSIYNPSQNRHALRKDTKIGSIYYQSSKDILYSMSSITNRPVRMEHDIQVNAIQTNEQQKLPITTQLDDVLHGLVKHVNDVDDHNDFLDIMRQNKRLFDTSRMTRANTKIHHTINTGNHPPTSVRPYYKTVQQRKVMQQEVGKLLDQGILRPSNSPWSSPVLLKMKPDGSYRFLVDFRRLNSITEKDSYPQPSAEELLYRLAGHKYFTKLDLRSGYFQIPIDESDIPKTAIITQDGLYEFTVLAQGLMNAPSTFQRVMNELLANGRWDYVVVYLDDIVIFSQTMKEHKQHVADVLSTLHNANFQVSPTKCSIAVETIEFLSHIVTGDKVKPSPDKIKAIVEIAPPKTLAQANKFIGKVAYYRKFIRDFAKIAAPIHKVTNKTRTKRHEFKWGTEQQEAFEKFKAILTTAPLFLDFPNHNLPFILSTDASEFRIAGVLKQHTENGMKICYYKSRLLNDTERRYSASEREALAIFWCLNELRNYIGDSEVTVETDHKPLVNMHRKKAYGNKRIDNWLIQLQDMIPQINEIKYRRGVDNAGPDYLTRCETISTEEQQQSYFAITRSMAKQTNLHAPPPSMITTKEIKATTTLTAAMKGQPSSTTIASDCTDLITSSSTRAATLIADLTLEKIKTEQNNDKNIQQIISNIRTQKQTGNFEFHQDLLYRLITKTNHGTKSKRIYLPSCMINDVLKAFHDHPISGHFGMKRTLYKISA